MQRRNKHSWRGMPLRPLLGGVCFAWLLGATSCGEQPGHQPKELNEYHSIIETGELVAVRSEWFKMPRNGTHKMRISGLQEHGKQVKAGDSIIQFDPVDLTKWILDMEKQLENEEAALEKLLVDYANKQGQAESNIHIQEASYDLKKLGMEATRYESERARKIKELELEQATLNLNLSKQRMVLEETISQCQIKIKRIRVQQIRDNIADTYAQIPLTTVRTTVPGILQLNRNPRTKQLVKVGDNVERGLMVACVPDITWMKVRTFINENDFLRIRKGQKVKVRLDALPEVVFDGEVSHIGLYCHVRNRKQPREKGFDVEVKMLVSDERLKPGMTVSCEYITDEDGTR